jgi:Flp pilus assembly protein TadG
MITGRNKTLNQDRHGQSLIEFALILLLMVLVEAGIFDLGRGFH